MGRGDGYDQLLSLWGIQESLLQTYRSIFITAESIVFAVAAAILTLNPFSTTALTVLGLFLLWMWHRVCSNRAIDVSFIQWMLMRAEEGASISAPLLNLKKFQAGEVIAVGDRSVWRYCRKNLEGKVNDKPFVSMTKSPTRRWMELYLPLVFLLLWLLLGLFAIKTIIWRA